MNTAKATASPTKKPALPTAPRPDISENAAPSLCQRTQLKNGSNSTCSPNPRLLLTTHFVT